MNNLIEFAQHLHTNKGATFNINTGSSPTSGYVIADGINERVLKDISTLNDINREVRAFAIDKAQALADNKMIGGWFEDGFLFLDVVEVEHNKRTAIKKGIDRGEIAIYDLNQGKEINLPKLPRRIHGTMTQRATHIELLTRKVLNK